MSTIYEFDFALARIQYELNDTKLIYRSRNRVTSQTQEILWENVRLGGYYPIGDHVPEGEWSLSEYMPLGVGHLMNRGMAQQRDTHQILVAYQVPGKRRRAMSYLMVRQNDPQTQALIADMRQHLTDRWHPEPIENVNRFRRQAGLSNWGPMLGAGLFLVIGVPLIFAVMAGWVWADDALWDWLSQYRYLALAVSLLPLAAYFWSKR